jgi:hypothetical protein
MSIRKIEGFTHEEFLASLALADCLLGILKGGTKEPVDACIVLMMAHAKLWHQYGSADIDKTFEMLDMYVRDFFKMTTYADKSPAPSTETLQ